MSLDHVQLRSLEAYLQARQNPEECCGGLRHTRAWIVKQLGRPDPRVLNWLLTQGATCDCAVSLLARQIACETDTSIYP